MTAADALNDFVEATRNKTSLWGGVCSIHPDEGIRTKIDTHPSALQLRIQFLSARLHEACHDKIAARVY